jgi:hypothetical protein
VGSFKNLLLQNLAQIILWGKEFKFVLKKGDSPSPRENNNKRVKIH